VPRKPSAEECVELAGVTAIFRGPRETKSGPKKLRARLLEGLPRVPRCRVLIISLEPGDGAAKVGLDDFFAVGGTPAGGGRRGSGSISTRAARSGRRALAEGSRSRRRVFASRRLNNNLLIDVRIFE
jgi:hypothetical protein